MIDYRKGKSKVKYQEKINAKSLMRMIRNERIFHTKQKYNSADWYKDSLVLKWSFFLAKT